MQRRDFLKYLSSIPFIGALSATGESGACGGQQTKEYVGTKKRASLKYPVLCDGVKLYPGAVNFVDSKRSGTEFFMIARCQCSENRLDLFW